MIRSYPLTLEGIPFRSHQVVGLYEVRDRVACVCFAFGIADHKEYEKDRRTPSYVLSDMFSADFSERGRAHLCYCETELFCESDAACYWESDRFLLNTKKYAGFGPSIAKLIEVRGSELIEAGVPPAPVKRIENDGKTYVFGDRAVRMVSQFTMECRSRTSGETFWRLKLGAYLYTEVEERNGVLYFGTAGKGGRFYGVSLTDGDVLFSYDTGGTERYAWYDDSVLLFGRKGRLVLLDPREGSEIRQIDLGKFMPHAYQHMLVKGDRFYAVAHASDIMHAVCTDL